MKGSFTVLSQRKKMYFLFTKEKKYILLQNLDFLQLSLVHNKNLDFAQNGFLTA